MNYINHINKYNNSQEIQSALDNGSLEKPYVAMTSAGTLDWNSLSPTPAETRMIITYDIQNTGNNSVCYAEQPYPFSKIELADGTDITNDLQSDYGDNWYNFQTTGLTNLYFTMDVDEFGDLFYGMDVVEAIVPEGIKVLSVGAFQTDKLEHIVLPESLETLSQDTICKVGDAMTGEILPLANCVIEFKGTTPPSISTSFGDPSKGSMPTIYVPAESVQAYKSEFATVYQAYADAVQAKQ